MAKFRTDRGTVTFGFGSREEAERQLKKSGGRIVVVEGEAECFKPFKPKIILELPEGSDGWDNKEIIKKILVKERNVHADILDVSDHQNYFVQTLVNYLTEDQHSDEDKYKFAQKVLDAWTTFKWMKNMAGSPILVMNYSSDSCYTIDRHDPEFDFNYSTYYIGILN